MPNDLRPPAPMPSRAATSLQEPRSVHGAYLDSLDQQIGLPGGIQAFRMHRDDPGSWATMPAMLERLGTFCKKFDTETEPQEIQDMVRQLFCYGDWRLGLWAVVMDGHLLVGHLLALPEPLMGDKCRYILVRQAEINVGVDLGPVTKQVFAEVEQWGRQIGVDKVVMVTHRDVDAMARRWGFKAYKALMRKQIPPAEG